ncbi:MAG: DNA polymerase III subunit beta [Deltaproteobacteria bacterium]|nr:DNA polymerase III subunit beta [Deltaproteobacteria bacterium]
MEFTIAKEDFIKILQRVQGIVEKRNTMPILANVLLEVKNNQMNALATDLEIFIKDCCKVKAKKDGAITINARKLYDIIKELPGENIDISAKEGEKLTIKCQKSKYNIMGLPAKEFPAFPAIEETKLKKTEKDVFKDMIEKTVFAVSTDETRYNINGFYIEKNGDTIKMVTTDGHRLALIDKKSENIGNIENPAILPKKGVGEFRKLLDENEGEFTFHVGKKSATAKNNTTIINVRLIEGEFPDYKQVIPKDNDKKIKINKNTFLEALKRVSLVSSEKIKGVKFVFSSNKLILNSSSQEFGDATEELEAEYGAQDIEIAFNAKYFVDALGAINEELVEITLKDALSPATLCGAENKDYLCIIMPMRL